MREETKRSEQAIKDGVSVGIIQDANSSYREKEKAFNELYSKYNKQVRFNFVKRLRDEDISDDLLMITFCKVHENINSYDINTGAFSTWLYKIANNTLIDYTRKAKFEVLSLDALTGKTSEDNDGMDFQIDSEVSNPEDLIVNFEVSKEIEKAVYSIKSKKIRDLMICRYLKELSFEETAEELGLEYSSAMRTAVFRGKKILEKKLENFKYLD